ncbi:protein masquerade-like [Diachasmimorpha longicaudata]|uniref:protein masquerade-like n=1 Tax=Diachasmimorpha longicaudata TaxID=58733 RepID=UPI0030B8BCDC
MTLKTIGVVIFVGFILTCGVRGQDDDSLAGSFLSGLLDTIANTANSEDCPGVCVHALATLICDEVLEDIQCPTASMRCCVNGPLNSTETSSENDIEGSTPTSTEKPITASYPATTTLTTTTTVATTTMSPSTTSTAVTTAMHREPDKPSISKCPPPGLCIEARLTNYCEAILDIDNLCTKPEHRCCVSKDAFGGNPPPGFYVIDRSKGNITKEDKIGEKAASTARPTAPSPVPATTPSTTTTTQRPKPVQRTPCKGECVNGLFALFCDNIDREADCPGGESCCITESPIKVEPTTTTPRPTTKPPQPKLSPCRGFCMLVIFAAFCERPNTIVSKTSTCQSGFICCDDSNSVSPVSKHRPKPAPTRPPATTISLPPDNRPDCISQGGSCIVSYISFTCFRNAELTNLFKCKKAGQQCCAPKFRIRGVNNSSDLSSSNRNDTISGGNFRPQATNFPTFYETPLTTTPPPSTTPLSTTTDPTFNKYVCGVKGTSRGPIQAKSLWRDPRVVGGEDADANEWCWQVALINSLNQYLCGGALVGTQWILTAAHCVTNIVRSGDAIYVRVGDHDLTRKYGSPGAQTLRVATTYIHHNHNSQTLDNDIALLKLHGQAELKDGVCLVCLPARGVSHAAGKRCTVTGYGYMGEAGPIPLRVREAEIPIVSDAECIRKVNAVTEKLFVLPASSFCAGGEPGNDACQGDGGGPLVCQDDGFYELTGLVSWGFGCGRVDVPGVYVKVSAFIGWISQIITVNNL